MTRPAGARHRRRDHRSRGRRPADRRSTASRSNCGRPASGSAARSPPRRSPASTHVDEGADAYLTRVPHAVALGRARSAWPATSSPAPTAATAMVWHDGLHDIPGGIVLGVPASVRPFVTTSLLSWRGKLRAAIEPLLPRTDPRRLARPLVRGRFGDEVHDRLVDALVGSIYATDTDHASLAAVPQLAQLAAAPSQPAARRGRRRRAAAPSSGSGPIFDAPTGRDGGARRRRRRVRRVDGGHDPTRARGDARSNADGSGWRVDGERFDAVVLATPPRHAPPRCWRTCAPERRRRAGPASRHADVIMVRLAFAADSLPPGLSPRQRSGYLVPKSQQRYVTAVSFGSQKWAHWQPADGGQILRVSLGRDGLPVADLDDDAVIDAVHRRGRPPPRRSALSLNRSSLDHPLARRLPAVPAAPRRPGRRRSSAALPGRDRARRSELPRDRHPGLHRRRRACRRDRA